MPHTTGFQTLNLWPPSSSLPLPIPQIQPSFCYFCFVHSTVTGLLASCATLYRCTKGSEISGSLTTTTGHWSGGT